MKPVENFDAATLARSLLRRRREGALATLMADSGDPYCSLVNLASQPDGAPILLISRLALHTQNVLADPRVSLMLDERGPKDPLQGARIMVAGTATETTGERAALLQRRYVAAHPMAEGFLKFKDFSVFAIAIRRVHLVAGFGRIIDLAPDEVLTDLTGAEALVAAEAEICAHMNEDHRETMALYATRLVGAKGGGKAGRWRCSGCDPDGLDLQSGATTLRLDFPRRVKTPAALRQTLRKLADQARAA